MGQVCHGSATTSHAVRAAIQRSQASSVDLSRSLGNNPKTVAKWRKRATVEERYGAHSTLDFFLDWTNQDGSLSGAELGLSASNVLDKQYTNALLGDAGDGQSVGVSLTRTFEF